MRAKKTSLAGKASEFIWNVIGGSMVVAMMAGVAYALIATLFSEFHGVDTYWDPKYFIRLFAGLLLFYLFLPSLFGSLLGGLVGLTSNTSKGRKN